MDSYLKDFWKSKSMESGEECAQINGLGSSLLLLVVTLDTRMLRYECEAVAIANLEFFGEIQRGKE